MKLYKFIYPGECSSYMLPPGVYPPGFQYDNMPLDVALANMAYIKQRSKVKIGIQLTNNTIRSN